MGMKKQHGINTGSSFIDFSEEQCLSILFPVLVLKSQRSSRFSGHSQSEG